MSRSRLLPAAAVTLVLAVFASATPTRAAGCEQFVANKCYLCDMKDEGGTLYSQAEWIQFSYWQVSSKFDMYSYALNDYLGCSCKTTGSFKTPHPNASTELVCNGSSTPYAYTAKSAASGRVKNVQLVGLYGDSYVVACQPDPTCSALAAVTTSGATIPFHHR